MLATTFYKHNGENDLGGYFLPFFFAWVLHGGFVVGSPCLRPHFFVAPLPLFCRCFFSLGFLGLCCGGLVFWQFLSGGGGVFSLGFLG